MRIFKNIEQGSQEWLNLRKGVATASRFSDIITPTGKYSKSSEGLMRKLVRESIIDDPFEFEGNKYTEWGTKYEPIARKKFIELTGIDVEEVGFVLSDFSDFIGCSPDGLIADESGNYIAGFETKSPMVDTHVNYLLDGELPSKYKLQVHGSMAVTGLRKWYFMSYYPELKPLIIEIVWDDFTDKIFDALREFNTTYSIIKKEIKELIFEPAKETEVML